MTEPTRATARSDARRARAEQIMDAAAGLLRAHGYRRVSIDDVAARAGVGKGTIYLHWRSREALFWAVIQRETIRLLSALSAALAVDPGLALPHRLVPEIFVAVADDPLVKALLLADPEVLGSLSRDETVRAAQRELAGSPDYLAFLAEHGVLPPGLTAQQAGHILGSVLRGFFTARDGPPLPEQAALLARVLKCSLEGEGSPGAEAQSALAAQVMALFQTITEVQQRQLERAY
jgi:AcrR family transcriptional regulator